MVEVKEQPAAKLKEEQTKADRPVDDWGRLSFLVDCRIGSNDTRTRRLRVFFTYEGKT